MKPILVLAILFVVGHGSSTETDSLVRRFNGHQVLRVSTKTKKEFDSVVKLYEEDTLDFWTKPRLNGFTDIMVTPEQTSVVLDYFGNHSLKHSVYIEDVERLVQEERQSDAERTKQAGVMTWTNYHDADEISSWLSTVAANHPNLASVKTIGRTSEGRQIQLIKISRGGQNNKAIFIDAGFHAREWIGPAVSTFFINELTTNATRHKFLDNIDFYILPIVNVDGYTWSRTKDRMWRKTRSNHGSNSCRGVDPNRNFGYQWGGSGTSIDKCSEIYKGPEAFCEPETKALRDFILHERANWAAYITLHSYSQVWLTPWGYTSDYPEDYHDMKRLADAAVAALYALYKTEYVIGSSTNVLYAAAGGSDDWAKSVDIKYAYTVELRDTGRYGFILPKQQIIPTAEETWAAIQVVATQLVAMQN